jgi:Rrf2 family protein
MPIPARVEYSLRALAALAIARPAAVNARTLADTQHIPPGYVYNVLADLRRADLVYALRGNHGGYALTRRPAEITVGTVIRLLDGPATAPSPLGTPDALSERLNHLWDRANQAGLMLLDECTIEDLITHP